MAPGTAAPDLEPLLRTLRAVGPEGKGNREAAQAWGQVVRARAERLPTLLAAIDEANPLAANWIRAAVDAIAERELREGGKLPAEELERFLKDPQHAPRARRLAYEWLVRVDPTAPDRLVPSMLDDRSLEMRRDAVARLIDQAARQAEAGQKAEAVTVCQKALTAARDLDQIQLLAERLRKLGQTVDLPRHFGFLVRWKVIGPFDNTEGKGYTAAYPPEEKVDPAAHYPGKHGEVKWADYVSQDPYGQVDLNKALGEEKDVVGYAVSEFLADRPQEVEFRVTAINAVKVWLNGRLIDEHHVYHSGSQMDQYVSRGTLQAGRNAILVKVCQNAQTQDWARGWGFKLRVCDAVGGAILSLDRNEASKETQP